MLYQSAVRFTSRFAAQRCLHAFTYRPPVSRLPVRSLHSTSSQLFKARDDPTGEDAKIGVLLAARTAADCVRWVGLQGQHYQLTNDATVGDALEQMDAMGVQFLLVCHHSEEQQLEESSVKGFVVSRDLLSALAKAQRSDEKAMKALLARPVTTVMTPSDKMISVTPEESLEMCGMVMSELNMPAVPVFSDDQFFGVVSLVGINKYIWAAIGGGKDTFVRNILPRQGGISQVKNPATMWRHLVLDIGVSATPHPKKASGVSEDAWFIASDSFDAMYGPQERVSYVGIADGVGSWAEMRVDPSAYSRGLMSEAKEAVLEGFAKAAKAPPHLRESSLPKPLGILKAAWKSVSSNEITGSSTACIAALDSHSEMLQAINIGDSGLYVFSEAQKTEMAGTMKREARKEGMHITYRSRQQLHSFNRPYQLGFCPPKEDKTYSHLFDQPADATVMHIPVAAGDLVVLATDGLFDNMDEEMMLELIHRWHGDRDNRHRPSSSEELAQQLVDKALELSLDKSIDSPFATLAKENDIMWSGGMPDDITVICMQVVQSAPTSLATP